MTPGPRHLAFPALAAFGGVFFLSGCATYVPVPKAYHHSNARLSVAPPSGWLRYQDTGAAFVITRDGLQLERIRIRVVRIGKKLGSSRRAYRSDMLPHEIAQLTLGLIEARSETKGFKVHDIELAEVVGRDGYKVDATFRTRRGLRKRLRIYGAAVNGYVCEFHFLAADPVYFEKYAPDFEAMVASARITDGE
ncbi:MAG: hypothetical protein IID36_02695 [Planctomycetes bacterium]|nr:hypothetical protein [Planctomycetota bacterium]